MTTQLQNILNKAMLLSNNTQIRLTAEEMSYTLFNKDGKYYIGILASDEKSFNGLPKFFPNDPEFDMISPSGKLIGRLQRIKEIKSL